MQKNQALTQKFDSPAPLTAVLDIPGGLVRLIAADRTDTTVEVLPADPAKSRDVKAAEQITVTHTDGTLRIETTAPKNRLLGPSGAVEVTVQLPTDSHVQATTAGAELRGVGRLGNITFDGAYRSVKLDEAATTHLTVHDGDVSIGRLNGPAEINTQRGDIHITEAVTGTLDLRTAKGDITVGAAQGVSAALDAGTSHGRVHNSLRNPDATPALTIRATTSYGDITARSL
ncbi:DUF4097 family beta strand repeat-containing protein [Streptomyces monashensis]|uniref:DUF4097 domain-containing protein n=1 Tax=Streptomyces monashensis TaxID=1678012 RepID=A0A1S2QI26_9ACTN|nr:DUF4097 family beta strand repeat-containing protein [Streptomyces monashensis]OIK05259.1 hypothetical protein BIV23_13440 [Streptomyces monashensis]OIK05287.1 hypothetical protein BIV23_13615 [Streptomyces monashensis]